MIFCHVTYWFLPSLERAVKRSAAPQFCYICEEWQARVLKTRLPLSGINKRCEPAWERIGPYQRYRCTRITLWNMCRRKLPTRLRSPDGSMESMSINTVLLPPSAGHPGSLLLSGRTLMHADVLVRELGELELPAGGPSRSIIARNPLTLRDAALPF